MFFRSKPYKTLDGEPTEENQIGEFSWGKSFKTYSGNLLQNDTDRELRMPQVHCGRLSRELFSIGVRGLSYESSVLWG